MITDLAPRNRELLAEPRRDPGQDRRVAPRHPRGPADFDHAAYKAFLHGDRLPLPRSRTTSRSPPPERRHRDHLAPPARSWWCRSSTPASRSTPPTRAGARCTTRSTAPTPSPKTDGAEKGKGYNKVRGDKVIAFAQDFLDEAAPLESGSHVDVTDVRRRRRPGPGHPDRRPRTGLADPAAFAGYTGDAATADRGPAAAQRPAPRDPDRRRLPDRPTDAAGVKDVLVESAVTTIMDFEDSVAAVDAEDKVSATATGSA